MCGILGIISKEQVSLSDALNKLKRLEYRGYDSCGLVTGEGFVLKRAGKIDSLIEEVKKNNFNLKSNIIVLHTRWATHGKVNVINAHPHSDCTGNIFVVHNGTIDNYKELREYLEKKGHVFKSETDSEIFAHWFEEGLRNNKSMREIALEIFEKFKGTYAVIVYIKNLNKLLAIKNGSPLVVGVGKDKIFIASDVYAFLDETQEVIILDDYEFLEIE